MRTANDGRGDETWEDPAPASSAAPDDDATRVISRSDLPARPGGPAAADGPDPAPANPADVDDADVTAVFSRDALTAPAPAPEHPGAAGDADATRAFARTAPDPDTGGSGFTRRFVRDRPGGRTARPDRFAAPADDPEPDPWSEPESDPWSEPDTDPWSEPDRDPGPWPEPAPEPRRRKRGRPAPGPHRRRRLRLRWIVTALLLTALALPPATWGWVWYTARQDDRAATDAIVVLGASQYNGVPSPVFEARLRHAQVLYLDGVAPVIVTVGGKQPGDNFTEAAAGRNWLIEVGIPSDRIIAVEEGSDTLQSVRAVSTVFADNAWDEATLVSDPWHSLRSKVMASDHGIDSGTSPSRSGPAVIERRTQLWYITRETASLWYYWIFNDSSDIRVNAA